MVDRYNNAHRSQYDEDCSYTTRVYGCTWTSAANGADATSGGRYRPSPDHVHAQVRSYEETDPSSRGWSIPDVALAMSRLGYAFVNRTNSDWEAFRDSGRDGHYRILQGDSDAFSNGTCSGAFDDAHAIGVHPDHTRNDDGELIWRIDDPICKEARWETDGTLYRYASRLGNPRWGQFNGIVPAVAFTPAPGDSMASAIRSESRRIASDSVVRVKAGSIIWADEKRSKKVRTIESSTLLMDFGVPLGAANFRAVRLIQGQFDTDDDREGGIGLVHEDNVTGGPRPATDEELEQIRRLFR